MDKTCHIPFFSNQIQSTQTVNFGEGSLKVGKWEGGREEQKQVMVIRSPPISDHTFQANSNYDPLTFDLITACAEHLPLYVFVKIHKF